MATFQVRRLRSRSHPHIASGARNELGPHRRQLEAVQGKVKDSKLTDDDIDQMNGNREQLEGRLQERYGYAKGEAQARGRQLVQPHVTGSPVA